MELRELIEKARQGDSASFEALIRMFQQKIFTFCFYMLGNRQEAEDAVQEVFIKVYQH